MLRITFAVLLFLFVARGTGFAIPPTTVQVLREMKNARSQLPIKVEYLLLRESIDPNDNQRIVTRKLQKGVILRNEKRKQWVCKRTEEIISVDTDLEDVTSDPQTWQRFNSLGQRGATITFFDNGRLRVARYGIISDALSNVDPSFPHVPYDFRMFGLALPGDYAVMNFDKLIKLLEEQAKDDTKAGYLPTPEWVGDESEGIVQYYFSGGSVKVNVLRDYWPVKREDKRNKRILGERVPYIRSSTKMDLKEVDGRWVPSYVELLRKDERVELFLDWSNPELGDESIIDEASLLLELKAMEQALEARMPPAKKSDNNKN